MGAEAKCQLRVDGATHDGKALLETDELLFREDARGAGRGMRLKIPLAAITSVTATTDEMRVRHADGEATFVLGTQAAKWAERIRSPRSLLDKLDVKAGQTISVLDIDDEQFLRDLRARAGRLVVGKLAPDSNLIFLGADAERDLRAIAGASTKMARDGAIWVVHPKGKDGLPDTMVFEVAKRAGLTYTKVARFSATHTAEKLVIPKAQR